MESLAGAYRDLESAIADLHALAGLLNIAVSDTIEQDMTGGLHDDLRRAAPFVKNYMVLILTNEQYNGLCYVLRLVQQDISHLNKLYYAGCA